MSRTRSSLELKACNQIEPLANLKQAARAWLRVAIDIEEIRKVFNSTWVLVNDAQKQEQKVTEEWAANVVTKWIAMLEDLVVRTKKQRGDDMATAAISTVSKSSVSFPRFCGPLHEGLWRR